MKNFFAKYVRFCPKTGKFVGFGKLAGFSRIFFPIVGLAALIWVLIRVIPKPARLSYPCMKTAVPLASGFLGYVVMLGVSAVAMFRFKKAIPHYPVVFMAVFAIFSISGFYSAEEGRAHLIRNASVEANVPMGVAQGIFPGRVVWVHNSAATAKDCLPDSQAGSRWSSYMTYRAGHEWFLAKNVDQPTVDGMLSAALQSLTGETSDAGAWSALFKYYNSNHGKGSVDYKTGEKIFIKTNATSSWGGNYDVQTLAAAKNASYGMSETSIGSIRAVLRALVNVVGVSQSDIYLGDPMKHIYNHIYDTLVVEFPNIHYLDYDHSTIGRERVVPGTKAEIFYADHGTILKDGVMYDPNAGTTPWFRDTLYTIYDSMEYMINLPMLKGHMRAGMTMFAKNHFGSNIATGASHLHNGLVAPAEMDRGGVTRPGYGLYRVQVDIMASSILGKKNLVYIMDGLWAADYEQGKPLKWQMAPFNDDFSSSMFASLDPVAIESVGYDFLRSEFTIERDAGTYVQMDGVDDYLHQAADSANWARGFRYDPDSTGTYFASLGVHEHWDNATDRKYSRNLGTGNGIELVSIEQSPNAIVNRTNNPLATFELYQNYPNPFNPTTTITYALPFESTTQVAIYDMQGRLVRQFASATQSAGYQSVVWNGTNQSGAPVASGMYIYKVTATSAKQQFEKAAKMILLK